MAERLCHGPVAAATKGAFSDEEINHIVDRMVAKQAKAKTKNPLLSDAEAIRAAAQELAVEEVKGALQSQRARLKSEAAKKQRQADMGRMTGSAYDRLEGLTIGSDKAGFGGQNSVDAMGHALGTELVGDVERGLRQAGVWKRVVNMGRDTALEADVATEMARINGGKFNPTGNADAVKIAEVLTPAIEKARLMQNDAGAWIGKLDGYIVRQAHDPIKVSGGFGRRNRTEADEDAAFKQWFDFIMPRLDQEVTFKGVDASERVAFMRHAWNGIVSGVRDVHVSGSDIEGFVPKAGKARQISAARVLHFNSPTTWFEYHNEYSRGSLFGAVVNDLTRAGNNAALMRRFGPDPDTAWRNEVARAIEGAGTAKEKKDLSSPRLQAAFDQVSGMANAPQSLRGAMIGSTLRRHQAVTKLGGMVLSAFGDLAVSQYQLHRAGVPFLQSYGTVFGSILRLGGAGAKEAAGLLDAGARISTGRMMSGVNMKDGALGAYTYLGRMNMMLQGFDFWNDGLRAGITGMLSKHMGNHADTLYANLPTGLKRMFERYGIDATDWDAIRKGAQDIDGERFVVLDGVTGAPADKARMLIQDTLDNATSEARGRENRTLQMGTQAGTIQGEAIRAFLQFWSFPMTYVNRSLGPAISDAKMGQVAPLLNLIIGTTLLGYASMTAKDITKGREPREITPQSFMAAMIQGGGLGIYGDFLFGESNRFGGGLLDTAAGPVWGDMSQLWKLGLAVRDGDFDKAGNQAFRLGKQQIPLVNLWYTRAGMDYLLWWRVQEAIDPGWASRYQNRIEKDTGAEFWLKPTEAPQ